MDVAGKYIGEVVRKMRNHRIKVLFWGVMMLLLLSGCGKRIEIKDIRNFSFSYGGGSMKDSGITYQLEWKDGVHTAIVKASGVALEDAPRIKVDEAFVVELETFLRENHVEKWNGFNKSDKHVMDGSGFSFSLSTMDSQFISASGYMKYPKNFNSVCEGISAIFGKISK